MQQAGAQYQPLDHGPSRPEEHDSGVLYGNRGYPSGPQPRYNRPVDYEEDIDPKGLMMSPIIGAHPIMMMHGPRSILLGFDDLVPENPPIMNPPMPQTQQRKGMMNTTPPSSRRGVSSYYSQPAIQASPIPEESQNISGASSQVMLSTWGSADYPALSPSIYEGEDDEDDYQPTPAEDGEQKGLVRQASLGRKSKPKLTEIRSLSRQDSTKQTFLNTEPDPNDSSLPTRGASPPRTAVSTPTPTMTPSPLTTFSFPLPRNYSGCDWQETETKQLGGDSASHAKSPQMYSHVEKPLVITKSMATKMKGRRAPPPGLNLNAVRDAEARGSLTSLPDLIRRATKLAAVLETGKVRAGGSLQGSNFRTESISDILASFPPPVPGGGGNGSRVSVWPTASDYMDDTGSSNGGGPSVQTASKKGRRVCCLPLWAFILLVILGLLAVTAAIIVPIQLVTISHSKENKSSANNDTKILQQCKIQNPCSNGGENVATKDFCGCVCIGGFSGKTCDKLDSSCVTMDLAEINSLGNTFAGVQNATMGSAIKRLFMISTPKYNVQLDESRVLSAFWESDVSCTAQNALVTFNGKNAPNISTTTTSSIVPTITPKMRRIKRQNGLPAEGTKTQGLSSTTTLVGSDATGNPVSTLNEDAVDFSRVAVLYLVQEKGLKVAVTAQENLQKTFTAGVDSGNIDAGNQVSVDLDSRVLKLPGGVTVGGSKTSS